MLTALTIKQINLQVVVLLDCEITILEVIKAVDDANIYKAAGTDCIPTEVLRNDTSVYILHRLFNVCSKLVE